MKTTLLKNVLDLPLIMTYIYLCLLHLTVPTCALHAQGFNRIGFFKEPQFPLNMFSTNNFEPLVYIPCVTWNHKGWVDTCTIYKIGYKTLNIFSVYLAFAQCTLNVMEMDSIS